MTTILGNQKTQDLLDRIAGLDQEGGNDRLKVIVRDVMASLFQIIEEHNVSEDELWTAVNFLGAGADEYGLMIPGVGLEHYMDVLMDAADKKAGIEGGTPRTIEGPLFVEGAPACEKEAIMSDDEDEGEVLIVEGVVKDTSGAPVAGAVIDVWHADTRGFYSHFDPTEKQAAFNNRRKIITGEDGRYKVRSIMPVGYSVPPNGATDNLMKALGRHGSRPAHVHYFVRADGFRHLTTQINIADDPLVHDDFAYATRDELIPELSRDSNGASITFDIELVSSSAGEYEMSNRSRMDF
jgi:catechol 1,2-dioxygenase